MPSAVTCYIKLPSGSTSKYDEARLCVPNSIVDSLFKHCHNSSLGSHFNGLRIYDRLRVLYTWPNMGQDIFKRCESCHSCNFTRPRHPDTRGIMSSTPPTRPCERLSVDLIKLPRSKLGNEYAVVFIDSFTRWPEAIPVSDKKATTIIRVMKEYIIDRHGIPNYLLSDEGFESLNLLVAEDCKLYGVTKVFSAAYHSRGHGKAEILNRTIEDQLKHTTNQFVMIGTYVYRKHYSQFGQPLRPVLE
jgi:hypothetical protein